MKNLLLLITTITLLTACNADNLQNSEPVDEFEVELTKAATEHNDDHDESEYDGAASGDSDEERMRKFNSKRLLLKYRIALKRVVKPIFDVDDSGDLSEVEKKTAIYSVRKCRIEVRSFLKDYFDTDDNGELSEEEIAVYIENRAEQRASTKAMFDVDEDGALSADEKIELVKYVGEKIANRLLEKYDANDDEKISKDEALAEDLVACEPFEEVL